MVKSYSPLPEGFGGKETPDYVDYRNKLLKHYELCYRLCTLYNNPHLQFLNDGRRALIFAYIEKIFLEKMDLERAESLIALLQKTELAIETLLIYNPDNFDGEDLRDRIEHFYNVILEIKNPTLLQCAFDLLVNKFTDPTPLENSASPLPAEILTFIGQFKLSVPYLQVPQQALLKEVDVLARDVYRKYIPAALLGKLIEYAPSAEGLETVVAKVMALKEYLLFQKPSYCVLSRFDTKNYWQELMEKIKIRVALFKQGDEMDMCIHRLENILKEPLEIINKKQHKITHS